MNSLSMSRRKDYMRLGALISVGLLLWNFGRSDARAVDNAWIFNGNGNWSEVAKWDADGVPNTATENAFIDDGDTAVTVTVDGTFALGNLTVGADDTVTLGEDRQLSVRGASIVNNGMILLNDAVNGTHTNIEIDNVVTLSGTGRLRMGGSIFNRLNATSAAITDELINSAGHTIEGGGKIGNNSFVFTNHGLIDANIAGAVIEIDPFNAGVVDATNDGTMQASNGGTLRFMGNDTFDNSGGLIQALDGSIVEIQQAAIVGGTLTSQGSGEIRSGLIEGGATFVDVTLSTGSQLNFATNIDASVMGTFTNNGTVLQPSDGGTMQLNIYVPTTLSGTGVWTMSGTATNNSVIARPSAGVVAFTNGPDHTIQGQGNIGNFSNLAIDNQGTILANVAARPLSVTASGAGSFVNSGTLRATSGATLTVSSGVTGTGGMVVADDTSIVNFTSRGAAFDGTTFSTAGTGAIVFSPAAGHILDDVTINGLVRFFNDADAALRGTITNNGTIEQNSTASQTVVVLDGNVTVSGPGVWKISNNANNQIRRLSTGAPTAVLTNDAGHTIQGAGSIGFNEIGLVNAGLVIADQATQMLINPSAENVVNQATGVMRGTGAGGLTFDDGNFDNQGTIEALNGSKVTYNAAAVTANNLAGILTGGTWRAVSTGGGATLTLRGNNITQIAAGTTVELNGAGSVLQTQVAVNLFPIDNHLTTNAGTLRIYNGRNFAMTSALANSGTVELGGAGLAGGTLNSGGNITNTASGVIAGHGTISDTILNSGTVRAANGTLTLAGRIDGQSGTVQVDAGATLDLSGAGGVSDADNLIHNGSGLNLGANNFLVDVDYQNANFGVGNAFNARSNVTGAGQILANPATTQTLGGNVTGGATATATMAFGNVHVGDTPTRNYQINNVGASGPTLRGAIQTSVGGANLTDSRLTGAGVTAGNFLAIPIGANSGDLAVTFDATSAGALSGQQVRIVNNFDNVAEQTLQITGSAYRLASPSAHTPEPVNFGIIHVGDTVSQAISITNSVPNDGFSERLNASIGSPTGSATTNSGSFTSLNPGATNNTSLSVGINTATAGAKSGTATISLTSNGTGTSGLGNTTLASQIVNISAQVNNFAVADVVKVSGRGTFNMTGPSQFTLDLGTTFEGLTDPTAELGVSNTADAPADSLAGSFNLSGATDFLLSGFGAFSSVAAGSTHDGLGITLDTATPGDFNGQITLQPRSTNARPFSMDLAPITIFITGTIRLAGDYNDDGTVDAADYAVWRDTRGSTSNLIADGNGGGTIESGDYNVWRSNFGRTSPGSGSRAAVPEPTTLYLWAVWVLAAWSGRLQLGRRNR